MKLFDVFKNMLSLLPESEYSDRHFEADCLIEFVLGKKRADLGSDFTVTDENREKLYSLCKKRREGYPLQYILGEWPFFDMDLEVGEGVLIPRRDTEDVCLHAFEYVNKFINPNVLDLCRGTGAIGLRIKKHCPHANVVALEKYDEAYTYLLKNIEKTGLCVLPLKGDVFNTDYVIEDETFDVIISNPPYIDPAFRGSMQKELTFEPEQALFAKDSGLRFYKFISKYYYHAIKDDGYLIFEYGYDQAEKVKNIILASPYRIIEEIVDSRGNPRGIIAQKLANINKKILE